MQHGHGGVDARHRLRLPRVEPRSLAQPAADGLRLLAQVDDLRTLHPRPTETSPARPTVPSQVKLAKCEADGVFSAANEGPFAGKAANHIPTIHCDGTAVTIKVPGSEDEVSRAPAPDETAGSSGPRAATRSIDDRAGRRDRARRRARSSGPMRRRGGGGVRGVHGARPAPRNGGGTRSRNRRSTTARGEPGADRGHGDGGALPLRRYVYAKREGAVIFYKEIKAGEARGPRPPTRARRRRRARARRRRRSRSRRARATTSPPLPRSRRPASGPRRRRSSHEKKSVARAASRPGRRGLAARGPSRPPH